MAPTNQPTDDAEPGGTVTVVMGTRNRAMQALSTVERLTALPESPAVVVVVDGSADDTERIIRRRFPAVRVLAWSERRGVAAARNAGVAAAATPYVAFADDDSWWAPGAMAVIQATFDSYPKLALAAGRILVGEEKRLDPTCAAMAQSPLPSEGLPGPRVLGFVACGAAVRRDAFLEVGGFPEEYVIGGEEEPLALELASAGWDLAYLQEAVAHHSPSARLRDTEERDRRLVRNDLWTAWRHRRLRGMLERTVSIVLHADTSAKRSGILEAAAALPRLLRHRRPVPAQIEKQRRLAAAGGDAGQGRCIRVSNGTRRSSTDARIEMHHRPARHPGPQRLGLVVITHNRVDELLANLERLTALPEDPHIVVVDGASSDGTPSAVRSRFPEVELMVLDRNAGAVARNMAVDHLQSRYIAFADNDSWWEAGSLRQACKVLDEHPDVGVVTARILKHPSGREDPVVADMRDSSLPEGDDLPGRPLVSFLAGASVIRREAFQQVGGFDPRMRIGGEEELLSLDLMAAGWSLRYLPETTVHHAASTRRDPHRRRAAGLRNALWCTWLRRPLLQALFRSAAILRRAPWDRVSSRAVMEALQGLPWVIRERRSVPMAVERQLRLIDTEQLNSPARRYIS